MDWCDDMCLFTESVEVVLQLGKSEAVGRIGIFKSLVVSLASNEWAISSVQDFLDDFFIPWNSPEVYSNNIHLLLPPPNFL